LKAIICILFTEFEGTMIEMEP